MNDFLHQAIQPISPIEAKRVRRTPFAIGERRIDELVFLVGAATAAGTGETLALFKSPKFMHGYERRNICSVCMYECPRVWVCVFLGVKTLLVYYL